MTFKAIGFDIDGTLYPSARLYWRLAWFGSQNFRHLRAFRAVRRELHKLSLEHNYRDTPPADLAEFHRFQASLVARRLGLDEKAVFKDIERLFYGQIPESFDRIKPFPGVREALLSLRDEGYPLGALSDFPGDRKLELLGLAGLFDVSMTSEETGVLKPDAKPFRALANRLGVGVEELLYVGNSVPNDVAGARAAGARAVLIRPRRGGDTGGAELVFRRYGELTAWVRSVQPDFRNMAGLP